MAGTVKPTPYARKKSYLDHAEEAQTAGFDVTCVIGRVDLNTRGEHSPVEAAMLLIARHDAEGTFSFPMLDGRVQRVTVEFGDA